MKKAFIILSVIINAALSAKAQSNPAEQLAERIAIRLKDSLVLSAQQKEQIYTVNMNLHQRKMEMRQQHAGSDSLRMFLQRIENSRDSLYKQIIANDEKFLLYKSRKSNLINNN